MSIYLKDLSPVTYQAIENLCAARGWAEPHGYMEPDQVAWLAYRMEFLDDSEEVFPKGKWATIQRLQDMVRKAAHADVHGVGDVSKP